MAKDKDLDTKVDVAAEDKVLKAKAEIFDILEAQAQLNAKMQQLEKIKEEKYKQMNDLRSTNVQATKTDQKLMTKTG